MAAKIEKQMRQTVSALHFSFDPPRWGAGREVVEAVAALRPRRIVLVGCDPAALARDLRTFIGRGCRIVAMSALDMFPHTHHFETIAVLKGA